MTDLKLLNQVIKESGMTMTSIALKSGINRVTLYNRLNGIGEFTATEIMSLANALKMSDEERDNIFLSKKLYDIQHNNVAEVV